MEEGGAGDTDRDRLGRGSSFRKSVSGLVRRVSQRVTRENKGMRRVVVQKLLASTVGRGMASKKDYYVDKTAL